MKFKIISVKGNSVRVRTGIATFDVLVLEDSGNLRMKVPPFIYISDTRDFDNLAGAVLAEYNHSVEVNHNVRTERENSITS